MLFKVHREKETMNDMTVANISKSTLPMYKIQYKHLTCPSLKTHQFAHYLDQAQSYITVFSQTNITTVIQTHCNMPTSQPRLTGSSSSYPEYVYLSYKCWKLKCIKERLLPSMLLDSNRMIRGSLNASQGWTAPLIAKDDCLQATKCW